MNRTCEEIVARASEPEGRLDEAVRAHAESCASCREALRALEELEATRLEPTPAALVSLRARLEREQRRSRPTVRRVWFGPALAGGLAAAAAAAALWIVPATHRGPATRTGSAVETVATQSDDETWLTVTDTEWSAENVDDGATTVETLMDWAG